MVTEERLRELSGELYTDYQQLEQLVASVGELFYPDGVPLRLDDSPAGQALERLPEAAARLFDQWDALRSAVESHYGKGRAAQVRATLTAGETGDLETDLAPPSPVESVQWAISDEHTGTVADWDLTDIVNMPVMADSLLRAAIEAPELRRPAEVLQLRPGQRRPRRPPVPPSPRGRSGQRPPKT